MTASRLVRDMLERADDAALRRLVDTALGNELGEALQQGPLHDLGS